MFAGREALAGARKGGEREPRVSQGLLRGSALGGEALSRGVAEIEGKCV